MKLMKYSWLAALPMVFTACQDDMLMEKHQQQGVYTLTATMDKGSADSRAQIVLNGTSTTKETFHWNEGDKFSLFQLPIKDSNNVVTTEMSAHEFTISSTYSEDAPAASADFSTTDALEVGREFIAFYPTPEVDSENPYYVSWSMDRDLPDNSEDSWKAYFKENMFMKVSGTVSNPTALAFEHVCGIIRITYKNTSSEDRKLEGIFVRGGEQLHLSHGVTYDISNDCQIVRGSGSGRYGINFDNGATIPAGESKDFYILYMEDFDTENAQPIKQVSVQISDTEEFWETPEYSKELPVFKAGKSYWLNVTDNGNELLWTNDEQGSGEIQDVVNVDVSTYAELKQALTTKVNQKLIVSIQRDIALEGPLSIISPTTLEMNTHTLSLADNYAPGESNAVFDVASRLNIFYGTIQGKDGIKLHDYYFALSGNNSNLSFHGVSLETGTAIANAIFMDDDNLQLGSLWITRNEVKTEVISSVETSGNAIHWVAKKAAPQYWSYITADVTGDFCFETQYETLNTVMIFEGGTINGNLDCTNVNGDVVLEDHIRKADAVTIASGYTGWDNIGRYVQNQNYNVSTFEELKAAIETPQEADESTHVYLKSDITLKEQLIVNKPVNVYMQGHTITLGYTLNTGEAAIINNDQLYIYDNGVIEAPSAGTEVDAYLFKSGSGMLYFGNVTVNAGVVRNAVYIKDGKGRVYEHATINASGYTLDIESDRYSDVDIYTGTLNGDVRWKLNSAQYTERCRFGAGPESTINGDLIWAGEYGGSALGYEIGFGSPVYITGNGWPEGNVGGDGSGDSGNNDIDPSAKPVATLEQFMNALTWGGPIYLTADIELTSPVVIEYDKPIFMNGKTISLSKDFDWGDADAAITSKSGLAIVGSGLFYGIESEDTIEKAFFKSQAGLQFEGVDIKPLSLSTAIYVQDGSCNVNAGSFIGAARRYAINMDADKSCDVDIWQSEVYGDIRFALNAPTYGNGENFCRFGVGPSSLVNGDLIIDGAYKDTATGYRLEVDKTAKTNGNGWSDTRIESVSAN